MSITQQNRLIVSEFFSSRLDSHRIFYYLLSTIQSLWNTSHADSLPLYLNHVDKKQATCLHSSCQTFYGGPIIKDRCLIFNYTIHVCMVKWKSYEG